MDGGKRRFSNTMTSKLGSSDSRAYTYHRAHALVTCACMHVWTCKCDFNTVRVHADFFKYGGKKSPSRKYPDKCGLNPVLTRLNSLPFINLGIEKKVSCSKNTTQLQPAGFKSELLDPEQRN